MGPHESKTKLLDALLHVVRAKGYAATRVEDVCAHAGLTKGSFFHHFKGKEDLALAAAARWEAQTAENFAAAPYHDAGDPLGRLIAYIEFRKAMLSGDLPEISCFAGTVVQEAYRTHPDVSAACARSITGHARTLEADISAALRDHGIRATWTPESLAMYMMAVIQGGLVLAKAQGNSEVAVESLDHLRRYVELLFDQTSSRPTGRRPPGKQH
jgi:TetR/AcrR family transcriptional repressor of nem operon